MTDLHEKKHILDQTIWQYIETEAERKLTMSGLQNILNERNICTVGRYFHSTSFPSPPMVKRICEAFGGDEDSMNLFIALKKATPGAQEKFLDLLYGS